MRLETLIASAREHGASDVHLEGGFPATFRVRGALKRQGEALPPAVLTAFAREVLGDEWNAFIERGSADLSRLLAGQRCRLNVLRTSRGVGFAIRLLTSSQATLKSLNLHPDLVRLVRPTHGLALVCGPTGSGKTSTLAALLQEINLHEARHIITVESPVEYSLQPRKSFIRQREVGRDTPSFEQALLDSLREDPDVLMVGELRDPEVMRLTLSAAETGHLVLATLHSSKAAEGLQRLVSAFAPEVQQSVCAQLADVLVGVVAQRLRFNDAQKMLVPECEVLMASSPVRALVRQGQFFKLASAMETGAAEGSFTFTRYAEWLARKTEFVQPSASLEAVTEPPPPSLPALKPVARKAPVSDDGALVISEEDDDLSSIIEELEKP
ncbi:MAG: ATPase, T2SS/T4P/T4SS family [Myxococcales bacterium]|nr:ATPase, T2SS/T4P/T4SS family [Myxococcales bacterium]